MMKTQLKFFIIIFVLLLQNPPIKAQWPAIYYGQFWPNSNNVANAIAVDDAGNCYVTGSSHNPPPGPILFHSITTVKYNSSGVQQWASVHYVEYGQGEGKSIVYDPINECIFVTGEYYKSGSPDVNYSIITIKYRISDGYELWTAEYDSEFDDLGNSVVCDANYVYVAGITNASGSHSEAIVLKYNSSDLSLSDTWPNIGYGIGTRVYSYFNTDIFYSLKVDPANENVYVTGESLNYSWNKDFITIKYNSDGEEQSNRYDSGGDDIGSDIAIFPSHAIYATGTSYVSGKQKMTTIKYNRNTLDRVWVINDQAGVGKSIDLYQRWFGNGWNTFTIDVFVTGYEGTNGQTIRYSNSGGEEWVRRFDGAYPSQFNIVKIDASENVFVAGCIGTEWNRDFLTVKYNSEGIQQGDGETIHYSEDQIINDMAIVAGGSVFVVGSSYHRSNPFWSVFLTMKYSSGDEPNSPFVPTPYIVEANSPQVFFLNQNYPNPFNPAAKIKYEIPQNGNVLLQVYDMLGREVQTLVNEYKEAGYHIVNFDSSKLSSGVYIYKLQAGQYSGVKKMILIK